MNDLSKLVTFAGIALASAHLTSAIAGGDGEEPPPVKKICHNIGGPDELGANCDGATGACSFTLDTGQTIVVPLNHFLGIVIPPTSEGAIAAHIAHGDGPVDATILVMDCNSYSGPPPPCPPPATGGGTTHAQLVFPSFPPPRVAGEGRVGARFADSREVHIDGERRAISRWRWAAPLPAVLTASLVGDHGRSESSEAIRERARVLLGDEVA